MIFRKAGMEKNNMAATINQYRPDYAVPPGWILDEYLEAQGLSQAEFARRCGRSAKLISEIIAGKAPVEPETALQFEKVLGLNAGIWLGIEKKYQLHLARKAESAAATRSTAWLKRFPIAELAKRGVIRKPDSDADAMSSILSFFGVASVEAWNTRYGLANAAYRHSPGFRSDEAVLATWLRLGEIEAKQQVCAEYDKGRFRQALHEIRNLTSKLFKEALAGAQECCNQSGVALIPVRPLSRMALSGVARWLSPRQAIIQLNVRHKTDDHLWFTLFHEAAHILLHSKKDVFVDGQKIRGDAADIEAEANAWASNALVPRRAWAEFVASCPRSEKSVRAFAVRQGIAPGIVVGMLQHGGHLPWSHLNKLKVRLEWSDEEVEE